MSTNYIPVGLEGSALRKFEKASTLIRRKWAQLSHPPVNQDQSTARGNVKESHLCVSPVFGL